MKRLLTLGGLWIFWINAGAAELTATLDRNAIHQTETVQLTISLHGDSASGGLDLKPLMPDFEVLGSAQSNQVSIINGHADQQLQWQLTLAPRRAGNITIPALSVGSLRTSPLRLTVNKAMLPSAKTDRLFLEVDVQPKQVFIQGQVLYTTRLWMAESLQSGSLSDPVVPNAVLLRLGTDSHYSTTRHGRPYEVIERHYGIFPQQSGMMTISPPTFVGQRLVDHHANPFFAQLKSVRLTAQPIELTVKPKPPNIANNNWLPAQDISVNETWSSTAKDWQAGEPITRTITLNAVGLGGEQLPDLGQTTTEGFNIYPSPPKLFTTANDKAVLGQRVINLTYIPIKTGELVIPAIEIPWWNTLSQKNQRLTLPERRVTVIQTNMNPTDLSTDPSSIKKVSTLAKNNAVPARHDWPWIITGIVTTAWLSTLWIGWRQRRQQRRLSRPQPTIDVIAAIKAACQQNNPQAAKTALLAWAITLWPDQSFRCLADIIAIVPSEALKAKLTELDSILYAESSSAWDGAVFWSAFEPMIRCHRSQPKQKAYTLPPLYPK